MTTWIFPFNEKSFRASDAFRKLREIDWGTNFNVNLGDNVFFYGSADKNNNEGRIILKTEVARDNVPENEIIDDKEFWGKGITFNFGSKKKHVRLKLIEKIFDDGICERLLFSKLKENGLKTKMQGQVKLDNQAPELRDYIDDVIK